MVGRVRPREAVLEEGKSQNILPGCPGRMFRKKVNLSSSLGVQGGGLGRRLISNHPPWAPREAVLRFNWQLQLSVLN